MHLIVLMLVSTVLLKCSFVSAKKMKLMMYTNTLDLILVGQPAVGSRQQEVDGKVEKG